MINEFAVIGIFVVVVVLQLFSYAIINVLVEEKNPAFAVILLTVTSLYSAIIFEVVQFYATNQ